MWISAANKFRKTGKIDPLEEYLNRYVFECESFDDLTSRIPDERFRRLADLDGHQPIIT